MPRNGSGTYSLPAGNPVTSGTLIEASWANTTLSDLSSAMTDSLARSGEGGMTGPLRSTDGSVSVPSLSFVNETSTGFYRAAATDVRFAMAGVDIATLTTGGLTVGSSKILSLPDGSAAAPALTNTGDTNTGVFFPDADTVAVSTGGTERIRVDANGLSVGDGSAAAPSLSNIGDTNTGVFFPDADTVAISTAGTERMRLTSSGNLSLNNNLLMSANGARIQGDFSNATLANVTAFQDKTTNNPTTVYALPNGTSNIAGWYSFNNSNPTNSAYLSVAISSTASTLDSSAVGSGTALPMTFKVAGAESARFDTSGNLVVKGTSAIISNSTFYSSTGDGAISMRCTGASSGKHWYIGPDTGNNYVNYNQNGQGVYIVDGGTSWTANSDERLKTDLVPIIDSVSKVSLLRAVTGRYLTDDPSVSRAFLIAQDVQAVLPQAVTENGQGYLGLAYSDVIPLLVAAIKELTDRVAALEAA